ncbi:hypothetical protein BDQ12DRAFT_691204, partial [Crucibulum laeve]
MRRTSIFVTSSIAAAGFVSALPANYECRVVARDLHEYGNRAIPGQYPDQPHPLMKYANGVSRYPGWLDRHRDKAHTSHSISQTTHTISSTATKTRKSQPTAKCPNPVHIPLGLGVVYEPVPNQGHEMHQHNRPAFARSDLYT